jgi:uncharacterized cofD-like protein
MTRKKQYPRIVCIGGGTGLSVLLRGLKKFPVEITAIVTVADDGGSSGRLRNDLQMPPPGDIRNVLIAMADTEPLLEKLFQHRFQNGDGLAGHAIGNLMIAAMQEITGDFTTAIKELSRVLAIHGRVFPASEQDVVLVAEMMDGSIVRGESQIPKAGKKIRRVFLHPPNPKPQADAIEAIREADGIVIGPGSLYTSILPNLLVKGMAEEIRRSKACKIYICNIMTQHGETDGFTASDHLRVIYDHVGAGLFDIMLVNNEVPPSFLKERYASSQQQMVLPDLEEIMRLGCHPLTDNLLLYRSLLRHDAYRISKYILRIVRGRLREHQGV